MLLYFAWFSFVHISTIKQLIFRYIMKPKAAFRHITEWDVGGRKREEGK